MGDAPSEVAGKLGLEPQVNFPEWILVIADMDALAGRRVSITTSVMLIHKYTAIDVHACKFKIHPETDRFLFLSSNLPCAIQLTCAMFEARLKTKS